MTTKKQLIMFGVIAVAITSLGVSTTMIEAESNKPTATGKLSDPFSFRLPDSEILTSSYSDISKSTPYAELAKGDTKNLPILIKAKGDHASTITFHATYGNQMDDIVVPKGMTAKIVPETISLKAGESKIINLVVTTDGDSRDALYFMNIVGVYGEGDNDFKGTVVKLIVGQGDDKFTLPTGVQ